MIPYEQEVGVVRKDSLEQGSEIRSILAQTTKQC